MVLLQGRVVLREYPFNFSECLVTRTLKSASYTAIRRNAAVDDVVTLVLFYCHTQFDLLILIRGM